MFLLLSLLQGPRSAATTTTMSTNIPKHNPYGDRMEQRSPHQVMSRMPTYMRQSPDRIRAHSPLHGGHPSPSGTPPRTPPMPPPPPMSPLSNPHLPYTSHPSLLNRGPPPASQPQATSDSSMSIMKALSSPTPSGKYLHNMCKSVLSSVTLSLLIITN